jgi:hypothetical protein
MRPALSLALVVALAALPLSVSAQERDPRAQASLHFQRGIELFNEGRFDAALAELQHAYDVMPAYPVLYNLGRVHAELGHPVEAARALERYLEEGGTAIPRARRAEVETALERQRDRIGRLAVEANVPGATISIDGVDVATLPLAAPLSLGAGAHTVGVHAPGYETVTRAVQIAGGAQERVAVELRREIEERGTLRISSALPDVVVQIDGVRVGRTPLDATIPVPAGDHRVLGIRPGYLTDSRQVRVEDRAEAEVRLTMELDPSPADDVIGTLRLRLPDVPVSLRIDGGERPVPQGTLRLPVGAHRIDIEAADRERWSGSVAIDATEPVTLVPPLEWTPGERHRRLASAGEQRTIGIALTIVGGALLAGAVGVVIWNEGEIATVDAEVNALNAAFAALGCRPAAEETRRDCIDFRNMLDERNLELGPIRDQQDLIRGVTFATIAVGVITAGIGIATWIGAPSAEQIDRAAHATLRIGAGSIAVDGAF